MCVSQRNFDLGWFIPKYSSKSYGRVGRVIGFSRGVLLFFVCWNTRARVLHIRANDSLMPRANIGKIKGCWIFGESNFFRICRLARCKVGRLSTKILYQLKLNVPIDIIRIRILSSLLQDFLFHLWKISFNLFFSKPVRNVCKFQETVLQECRLSGLIWPFRVAQDRPHSYRRAYTLWNDFLSPWNFPLLDIRIWTHTVRFSYEFSRLSDLRRAVSQIWSDTVSYVT